MFHEQQLTSAGPALAVSASPIGRCRRPNSPESPKLMKTKIAFMSAVVSAMAITFTTAAQTLSGTNAPNTGTNFSFTVGAGATNLSLVISNSATAYSHLYLKRGGPAATNDFDFVARVNGQTNQINLELPEFMATSYGLRVVTPATSAQHAFNVVLTTNSPIIPFPLPALKPGL